MTDRNLIKGAFLIAISLGFGLPSLRYPIGSIENAGPGLFPLVMSCVLFLIGVAVIVRSRFILPVRLTFTLKNIALVTASLALFAAVSTYVNMIAGIVAMVFCASFAATSYSVVRNLKIAAGLIVVAFAFQKLLGLQLPLL
jgi:hypothetical protein